MPRFIIMKIPDTAMDCLLYDYGSAYKAVVLGCKAISVVASTPGDALSMLRGMVVGMKTMFERKLVIENIEFSLCGIQACVRVSLVRGGLMHSFVSSDEARAEVACRMIAAKLLSIIPESGIPTDGKPRVDLVSGEQRRELVRWYCDRCRFRLARRGGASLAEAVANMTGCIPFEVGVKFLNWIDESEAK